MASAKQAKQVDSSSTQASNKGIARRNSWKNKHYTYPDGLHRLSSSFEKVMA